MKEIFGIKIQTKLLAALVALMAFLSSMANASLIVDFDSINGFNLVSNSSVTESGFNFDLGNASFILNGSTGSNFGGFDSQVLEVDGLSTFVISLASDELFDFNSVLASQSGNNPLSFVGVFSDSSTIVSDVFAPPSSSQGASVLSFVGFNAIAELRVSTNNSFALFDDFTFDTATTVNQVPVPVTFWMFVLGLIILRFSIASRR